MEQKRITLASGIELEVVDTGTGNAEDRAPVLIFLHGFPENHRTWRHQIAHFSQTHRCIAPDQRGYRNSSRPRDVAAYTPDKLIGDIFQLADALGVGEFTVVGHDWGGAIAWGVAIGGQSNGRVTRCVIANAPHPAIFQRLLYTDKAQRASSQYIRGFRDPANDPLVREHGLGAILMQEVKWERAAQMEAEERDRLLAEWQDREAAFGMLNWYRASPIDVPPMDAPFALPEGWTPPPIPKLTIPTLVIWAMDDLALPPENLAGLDEVVEDLTVVKVSDRGHFVPWEAPDKVNAAMDAFFAQSEASKTA